MARLYWEAGEQTMVNHQVNQYNEYHLNPEKFPFLKAFQEHWLTIRNEFIAFQTSATVAEQRLAAKVMGPKSKTITTRKQNKYKALGFFFQGQYLEDYIQAHRISYGGDSNADVIKRITQLRQTYFPQLTQVIHGINAAEDQIIRNVYFGTFLPGLDIKLHVNDNPHMNRGYLGLIIPKGDVAMKICHEKLFWHEGKFMVLDHSFPHCPHNYTTAERTVLVVDFFRPDQPRYKLLQFEKVQVAQRMQDDPYSLGIFGQSDQAQEADFIKYGLAHQLEWDQVLGA